MASAVSMPTETVVSVAFSCAKPLPSAISTPSAASPMPLSAVWPVPQTQVLARETAGKAVEVAYSPAPLAPPPPAVPFTRRRFTVHCVPHSTTITVLVAAVRLLAPPASRVQLMMLVPLGKRRTWQTLASAAWVWPCRSRPR